MGETLPKKQTVEQHLRALKKHRGQQYAPRPTELNHRNLSHSPGPVDQVEVLIMKIESAVTDYSVICLFLGYCDILMNG